MSRLLAAVFAVTLLVQPAHAVDTITSTDAPDLAAPRAMIKAKDWPGAIAALKTISQTTMHADVYSLLGYSLRNAGDIAGAKLYYAKALDFDPKHKGAHEYLGELYLKTGDRSKAEAELAILRTLCPQGCEELDDLTRHIAEADAASSPSTRTN